MIKPKTPEGLPATEVIEEAIALLRRSPAATILCSFVGTVPFWLALLYFFADMSHDAYAAGRLAGTSLLLVALYLWKKCWATVYTSGLLAILHGETPAPWTAGRIFRMVLTQAEIQLWGLLLRPLAYHFLIPSAWVSAYYQGVTVLGDGRPSEGRSVSSRAWRQASVWPRQNHFLISILVFVLVIVWINVTALCAVVPGLLKSFLGIETMASRQSWWFFNATFFCATGALAFLLVDPLWRAAYVIRCFHGTSLQTGADVRSALRSLRARAGALAFCLVLAFSSFAPAAMKNEQPAPAAQVDARELDRSIERTLERREFAWRFRRVATPEKKEAGFLRRWMDDVGKWVERNREAIERPVKRFLRWLRSLFWKHDPEKPSKPWGGFTVPFLESVLYGAAALVVLILVWVVWRVWRPRRRKLVAQAVTPLPDLHADDVQADQLPEDEWLQLARELAARGELRLALRAAYLAGLACLGQHELVSIARHKSNLDYQRELRRRARSREGLLAAFDENLLAFERAWYGDHTVTLPHFEQFTQNLERIRAC